MSTAIYSLVIIGVVLLLAEVFLPGGVLGFIGLGCLTLAIFLGSGSILQGVIYNLILYAVLGLIVYVTYRFPKTRKLYQRLTLRDRQLNESGYTSLKPDYKEYLGMTGKALTKLRPAGTGEFAGKRLDVVSQGDFIDAGTTIKVVEVDGTRIVVAKAE